MRRACQLCGEEYKVPAFSFDKGCCSKHARGFFSEPLWFRPSPEGTRSLWDFLIKIHFVYIIPTALLDPPIAPIAVYSLAMVLYFGARSATGYYRGYPILTNRQITGLAWLPLYGPILALVFSGLGQIIRHGP